MQGFGSTIRLMSRNKTARHFDLILDWARRASNNRALNSLKGIWTRERVERFGFEITREEEDHLVTHKHG